MNQQPQTEKKSKTRSKVQIRDLKPKENAKGGDGPTETIAFNYTKPHVQYRKVPIGVSRLRASRLC